MKYDESLCTAINKMRFFSFFFFFFFIYRDGICVHMSLRLFCIYRIHGTRLHLYQQSRKGGSVTKAYLIQATHGFGIVRVTSRVPCARVSSQLTKTNFNSKHDWICANCIFSRNVIASSLFDQHYFSGRD